MDKFYKNETYKGIVNPLKIKIVFMRRLICDFFVNNVDYWILVFDTWSWKRIPKIYLIIFFLLFLLLFRSYNSVKFEVIGVFTAFITMPIVHSQINLFEKFHLSTFKTLYVWNINVENTEEKFLM